MLEKIGLPPKPSLKGNEWVLDASHCQGCSSAFTFFNRKHHCRRCGGIFCGNCTQQRINLRGQGEGPVRICDPCKKLEDAARFESRYGHRNKVSKGSPKSNSLIESDPLFKELIGHDSNTNDSERTALMDEVSELIASKHAGSTSRGELDKTANDGHSSSQVSPEMLLLQAQEEKKQWLALKKEGKGEEALQAFKRGKEMERQAENLKLSLRRSQRKATTSTPKKEKHEEISKSEPRRRTNDVVSEGVQGRDKSVLQKKSKGDALKEGKGNKDDIMDALKEVGWSDEDLQDTGGKQSKAKTVENELAELAAAMHQGNNNNRQKNTSSMEVLAHKRRALALKREGNLAEAKEELKKAKLMERQLEEQQMFGDEDEEESDDDLRALIRDMDKESSSHGIGAIDLDFSILGNIHEEEDEGVDVTDVDMDDPEMVAALRSMGWEEEATQMGKTFQRTSTKPSNTIQGRKSQQAVPEGLEYLGEMEVSLDTVEATEDDMKDPYFLSALKAMGFEEEEPSKLLRPVLASIPKPEDKRRLQQEVLFLKKEALALKRAGKLQQAKEELHRAKQLEKELQEFDSQHDEDVLAAFSMQQQPSRASEVDTIMLQQTFDDDAENVDVTEEDMGDPELVKTLKSLGWQDDHETEDCHDTQQDVDTSEESFLASHKLKTKSQLQKELLGVKRAALKLRREGKTEEAEEELKKAHMLEQLMEESGGAREAKHTYEQTADGLLHTEKIVEVSRPGTDYPITLASLKGADLKTDGESLDLSSLPIFTTKQTERPSGQKIEKAPEKILDDGRQSSFGLEVRSEEQSRTSSVRTELTFTPVLTPADGGGKNVRVEYNLLPSSVVKAPRDEMLEKGPPQRNAVDTADSRAHVKEPLGAKRESRDETLEKGPALLPHRTAMDTADVRAHMKDPPGVQREPSGSCDKVEETLVPANSSTTTSIQSLQQEVLALKRQAIALKREGRLVEAKEKLREAKLLEKKFASDHTQSESSGKEAVQSSARRAELQPVPPPAVPAVALPKPAHTSPNVAVQKSLAGKDRMKLQQESLAHKRKALALRREGNTEAADMEFELAKSIEKQMEDLGGVREGHSAMPQGDDVGSINDIFDPQLLAALKGLGWKESDILQSTPEVRQETSEKPQEESRRKSTEAPPGVTRLKQSDEKVQPQEESRRKSTEAPPGATRLKQSDEKVQLEEKIRSEKIRALHLKRSGQQTEALEVLRGAKLLERKLQSMS